MVSTASTASVASVASMTSFHQKNDWYWWLDHSWHHNGQHLSLIVEWILENPIFHWYLVPFLSEAVEASQSYFFQNWLMKLKCPNLLKPLSTIFRENYQPFCPSEPFRILRFQMRHPVVSKLLKVKILISTYLFKTTDSFFIVDRKYIGHYPTLIWAH